MGIKIQKETLNTHAFYKALEDLLKLFPEKGKGWIDSCTERAFDTEMEGYNDKKKCNVFKVFKNKQEIVKHTRFLSYIVYLYGEKRGWCNCYYGKFGSARSIQICSHVGASILFTLYLKHLNEVKQ